MTTVEGQFGERGAQPRVRSLPLSHLSLELGHLYMEDVVAGPDRVRVLLAEAAPWAEAAAATARAATHRGRPRISTCFLVDDYFSDLVGPDVLVPLLLDAAAEAGVLIDYLARESACAQAVGPAGAISPAELLVARLVAEPPPGTTGTRPPATESGWLANGQRSPATNSRSAMDVAVGWRPPSQTAKRRHSIFVDVELWDDDADGHRTWSCALLAAVWHLLRLGLIRSDGQPVVEPAAPPDRWPASWHQLPPVVRLNERAQPFAAYAATSILSPRFLDVEAAARTIVGQVWVDPTVADEADRRARAEGFVLPGELTDRITYAFAGSRLTDVY